MPVPDKRTVLVAVDGSEYSEKAFDWYAGKFRQANDQVVFLHVYEAPITPPPTFAHCTSLPSKEEWELMLQKAETKAKKMLAKFEKKCKDYKLPFKSIFAHGAIGHMICTTAKEENVEVIVLGNRGLGTIRRTIFGSVCDYVTQRMPVPVLMVPTMDSFKQ
ncbi:universal stress protein YxiE-like [Montipora capricornis]|uniref:universal stress protein YxiE-like n=1 Tax=Montipora foliosa TaxID=591990 RepID=UPI0035F12D04